MPGRVALVQLATEGRVYLLDMLALMGSLAGQTAGFFQRFLSSPTVLKLGELVPAVQRPKAVQSCLRRKIRVVHAG